MADIHKAEAVVEANSSIYNTDSTKRAVRQSVLAAHGLTTEMADSSFNWYGYNMDRYVEVYERTIEILTDELAAAEQTAGTTAGNAEQHSTLSMEGDSVDVWTGIRLRRFSRNMPGDIISFSLNTDANWEHGDIYRFKSKMFDNRRNATFNVVIEYTDGSIGYRTSRLIGDGWHEVEFAVDSAKTARNINGTISYTASKDETAYIDSISLTRVRLSPQKRSILQEMNSLENKPYRKRP